LKYSLVQVHKFCTENGLRSHLVNNVHDEVMIDFDRKELPLLLHEVPTLMNYLPIGAVVPIRPEPDISFTTWADKVPYTEEALAA
jgi:DNA polymerase I-like protein with 3'-5' exonuclease and polymerase domains